MKMIYGVKDKPKFPSILVFAFQQLLAIMAATIAVPMIVGHGMSTSAALFGAGVGTLVYVAFTKGRSPVFLGSSFAFLGSMATAFAGGITVGLGYIGLILGAVFAGLVYVIIAIVVKFVGVKWIAKVMPAVVIGPVVAIIGLSLATNAIGDLSTTDHSIKANTAGYYAVEVKSFDEDGAVQSSFAAVDKDGVINPAIVVSTDDDGKVIMNDDGTFAATEAPKSNRVALLVGLFTLAMTMFFSVYGRKIGRLIPFIIGIMSGYFLATVLYFIGKATGNELLIVIDYTALTNNFRELSFTSFFALPDFTFLKAFGSIGDLNMGYVGTIAVAFVPVAFVVFAEHIADHKNLSTIIEHDLLVDPGLSRTLLGDGVGSMVGAFFGGCPNTTYGESVGCVAITKNASVRTIVVTAIEAIIISFIAPFVAFLSTIPHCVMGGVCIALYGFIAVSGLKMIQKTDLDDNSNLFTVSVILIAGVGGIVVQFGRVTVTEVAFALILGILTNGMLAGKRYRKAKEDNVIQEELAGK